jgi:hypothetical protein
MKIEVLARSKARKLLLLNSAEYYAKKLNLKKSKYTVYIESFPGLAKNYGDNGNVCKVGRRRLLIRIDSKLSFTNVLNTLAHEMVHVKQFARGQFKAEKARNGKFRRFWMGKRVTANYFDRPWEIEAYQKQDEMAIDLIQHLISNLKKKKIFDNKSK